MRDVEFLDQVRDQVHAQLVLARSRPVDRVQHLMNACGLCLMQVISIENGSRESRRNLKAWIETTRRVHAMFEILKIFEPQNH